MFISDEKTFDDAMKPLIYFNWVAGMGAFRLSNQSYTTYVLMKLYTVFITLVNWTAIYVTLSSLGEVLHYDNTLPMAVVMYKALVCTNSCTSVIGPLLVWLRRTGLKDCLGQMRILDKTFQAALGAQNEYRKQYIRMICQVIAIFLVMTLVGISDTVTSRNIMLLTDIRSRFMYWSTTQALHQPIQLMLLLDVNFCTFVGYLGKKFRDINDSLLGLTKKPSTSFPSERMPVVSRNLARTTYGDKVSNAEAERLTIDKQLLRKIRKTHLELCKLSRKINLVFGVQNLLSTGISFVMITGLLYTIYSAFSLEKFTNGTHNEVIPSALWAAIYVFKIGMVNHSCRIVSNEAERTGEVIYELLDTRVDKELQKEIQEFGIQMLQNPVRFSACGFFTLDHTFVQGVIGSVTTYLVILIQMSNLSQRSIYDTVRASNDTDISRN